jgi:hypothetical protein
VNSQLFADYAGVCDDSRRRAELVGRCVIRVPALPARCGEFGRTRGG